jgi:hypothetical protein
MRKLWVVLILAVAFISQPVGAQRRLTSASIGSGEDAIAGGITGIVRFGSADSTLYAEFAFQPQQAWFVWGRALKGRVGGFVAGSVGHFQGAPWVGPYVSLSLPVTKIGKNDLILGTFHWPAVFIGGEPSDWKNDGVENPESIKVGYLASASLTLGPIGVNYSMLNFLEEPWNHLPGASLTVPIVNELSFTTNYTWNGNKERSMYYMGVTWTPKLPQMIIDFP